MRIPRNVEQDQRIPGKQEECPLPFGWLNPTQQPPQRNERHHVGRDQRNSIGGDLAKVVAPGRQCRQEPAEVRPAGAVRDHVAREGE